MLILLQPEWAGAYFIDVITDAAAKTALGTFHQARRSSLTAMSVCSVNGSSADCSQVGVFPVKPVASSPDSLQTDS